MIKEIQIGDKVTAVDLKNYIYFKNGKIYTVISHHGYLGVVSETKTFYPFLENDFYLNAYSVEYTYSENHDMMENTVLFIRNPL